MTWKKGGKKRFWSDEEKQSIRTQTRAPGVSVAQVARRYTLNANLVHKWLGDPRFVADCTANEDSAAETARFPPVEIEDVALSSALSQPAPSPSALDLTLSAQRVDLTLSDGRRILVEGTTAFQAVLDMIDMRFGSVLRSIRMRVPVSITDSGYDRIPAL